MSTNLKPSKLVAYIFVPILLSLIVSAIVNLQLFQDGSSYLFEILVTHSAIRHHRLSVFLIQGPTILIYKVLTKLQADPNFNLQVSRLIFNLSYALIPLVSLILSWFVIRRRNESLFIWAALIILFINLVNFSWVSELLIALQLSCPLLLISILVPGTKPFWIFTIILLPIIFLLHPLVLLIFVAIAVSSAYVGYRRLILRKAAWLSAIIFLGAAILRGIFNLYIMSPYETSFLESSEMNNYFFITSLENKLFLLIALIIAIICLMEKSLAKRKITMHIIYVVIGFIQILSIILIVVNLSFLSGYIRLLGLAVCIGGITFYQYRYYVGQPLTDKIQELYIFYNPLTVIAACLLISQYFSGSGKFPLKTGLVLFVGVLIMFIAAVDSTQQISDFESKQRLRLVQVLAIIFSLVIISKSLIWRSSVQKLEQTLVASSDQCIEIGSENFPWLEKNPYNIINNWSLPSLALVSQDSHPRKLLLEKNACKLYQEAGMVHLDPWTHLPKKYIVPPLD